MAFSDPFSGVVVTLAGAFDLIDNSVSSLLCDVFDWKVGLPRTVEVPVDNHNFLSLEQNPFVIVCVCVCVCVYVCVCVCMCVYVCVFVCSCPEELFALSRRRRLWRSSTL